MKKGEFKIYSLICPITKEIKYIGKTCFELFHRLRQHLTISKDGHKTNWIKFLKNNGLVPEIKLIKICRDEKRCNYSETFFIKLYGRKDLGLGLLLNHTDGGDGAVGYKHTEETRKIIKEKRKNQVLSPEVIYNISHCRIGKKNTPEQNEKISKAHIGMKPTEETRIKLSNAQKGRPSHMKGKKHSIEVIKKISDSHKKRRILYGPRKLSEEHKRKIGERSKGRKLSEEAKQKISKKNKGRKPSEETRRKLSEAGKGRICKEETRLLRSIAMTGKKHTEETKLIISQKNTGKIRSEELKKQISIALKGRKPWNQGLIKEDRIAFLHTNRILMIFTKHILKIGNKRATKFLKAA